MSTGFFGNVNKIRYEGANSSNPHLASRGKIGVLVSCGAAAICGASVTLINFFWNVGQQV